MSNSQNPLARKDGLVVQEMPEEVLVYDLKTNKAHCLNRTAAFVWKNCTGENSVEEIVSELTNHTGKSVDKDLIWLAIDQLNEKNLLEKNLPVKFAGQSRRAVLKKIGFASVVALPVVASLVAPTAILAVTCSGITDGPAAGGRCCGGVFCPGAGACVSGACPPVTPPTGDGSIEVNTKKKK